MYGDAFGDVENLCGMATIEPLRRNLQHRCTALLVRLANDPAPGTPDDARSLARADLVALGRETRRRYVRAAPTSARARTSRTSGR